ncbi:alpha/beta fold hydrolase [Mycobacterium sp. Aquia_216]|uniref:alpha/beta fold hydrolase n=1 Tax=Mycobacterium sp. Aquia_216 TaxID=2991729 RepID=UPI00227AD8BC|nr:alpha/beta hydrolase [Mycobacterium sp. Aquia_216]WAJ47149.1 alpha/beta fold hydrolase [Mycobacterium sp. Aquia_216]
MAIVDENFVATSLGRLHLRRAGTGPTAVLWHSLFVDSRSWGPLFNALSHHRTVVAIDGPSHGMSDPVGRDFSFGECVHAALEALDALGIDEPVDWVGNAWGGHVGILLAATQPHRIRTLTTISTPVPALSTRYRVTRAWPLVAAYRLLGPAGFLCAALADALLGPHAIATHPGPAAAVIDAFREADHSAMYHAMRSMMLKRPNLSDRLPSVVAPTLMLAARDDNEGWPLRVAAAACATMPDARTGVISGGGRVAPLLLDADPIERTLVEFWSETKQIASP